MHSHVNALLIVVVFWSDSLWYWRYKSISPVYNNFTSFFPVCIPLFSFSCLIALPNASRTMLNNSSDSRHFCHIHNSMQISLFLYSAWYRLLYWDWYIVPGWEGTIYSYAIKFLSRMSMKFCQMIFHHWLLWLCDILHF